MKQFELGQPVIIRGRNGVGPENVAVYGARGRIVTTHLNAPNGWLSVWLDEPIGGYNVVNMPPEHLEVVEEKPALRMI